MVETGLGEEFVGIADEFLFHRLRQEITHGERQMPDKYLVACDACTGMAFADAGMAGEAFCQQHSGSDVSVTDIRFTAETLYGGRIAAYDSDVVQHGGLFDEPSVEFQLRMPAGDGKGFVGHRPAVDKEDVTQGVVLRVKFVDDCLIIHCLLSSYRVGRDRAHPVGLLSSGPVVIALLSPASALVDLPVLSISAASVWPALLRLKESHT